MELLGMLGIGGTRWGHVWDTFGTRLGCLMLRVVGRMLRVVGQKQHNQFNNQHKLHMEHEQAQEHNM